MKEIRNQPPLTRRLVLAGGVTGGMLAAAAPVWAQVSGTVGSGYASKPAVTSICDIVIPATDTPGAVAAGVPEFVAFASNHGLLSADGDTIAKVSAALQARTGTPFDRLARVDQEALLEAYDQAAFAPGAPSLAFAELASWRAMKALIVVGYYTSEIGASQELEYNPVPGRYIPDVKIDKNTRALMNDWLGNAL